MMLKQFWKVEFRKVWPFYSALLFLTVLYIIFAPTPLGKENFILSVFAALQGVILAVSVCQDPANTQAFLFSRSVSRKKIFIYRWCFSLLCQIITIAVLLFVMASGLRQYVQLSIFESPWFPYVRWFETSSIISFSGLSFFIFQVTMFFILEKKIKIRPPSNNKKNAINNYLEIVCIVVMVIMMQSTLFRISMFKYDVMVLHRNIYFYTIFFACISTCISFHYFTRMEVED
jgi:hypothetical protein